MQGTIKRLISEKGFGFIATDEAEKDVFFHSTALDGIEFNQLREGDNVTFDVEQTDRGLSAVNVKVA